MANGDEILQAYAILSSMRANVPSEYEVGPCKPDWDVPISEYFNWESVSEAPPALYVYDFGDDWHHLVTFEDVLPGGSARYPRCVAGGELVHRKTVVACAASPSFSKRSPTPNTPNIRSSCSGPAVHTIRRRSIRRESHSTIRVNGGRKRFKS